MERSNEQIQHDPMSDTFKRFYGQVQQESDRGAVIVSVALLDDLLTNLIKARLVPSVEKDDELFDSAFSPFRSFSTKVDLAYRLGLIGSNFRCSLHLLRKIRNNFAHAANINGFDQQSTQDRIRELVKINHDLLNLVVKLVKDSEPPKDIVPELDSVNDLVSLMGWRGIVQLTYASLAGSLADAVDQVDALLPRSIHGQSGEKKR